MAKRIHIPPETGTYKVSIAGDDTWHDIDADNVTDAGEKYAAHHWGPSEGETTFELDVKTPSGKLFACTVDVAVTVSFDAFATEHPCGEEG